MINIVVTAPKGAMDSLIIQEACKSNGICLTGCVGNPDSDYIGKDAGLVCGFGQEIGVPVCGSIEEVIDDCDIVVDFSRVELSMEILDACIAHKKGFICGTTGFSPEQTERLLEAGKSIPMMKAANTSYVMNVMRKLLGIAAEKLGDRCGIDIIELHSSSKLDAPSGTALELAEEMKEHSGDRTGGEVAFHSIRSGNTPSEHRVVFGCMGEKMEISHEAFDWRCYAKGACDAVLFMGEKIKNSPDGGVGLYTMDDVIGT